MNTCGAGGLYPTVRCHPGASLHGGGLDLQIAVFPMIRASILVLKKQSSASCGLQTTGSFSLNEVLSNIGYR
jgi:hypothetical protein